MPRNSLDAESDVIDAYLRITSRISPKLSLKAAYRYHERDDEAKLLSYNYFPLDKEVSSLQAITASPLYYQKHSFDLKATYRLFDNTSVTAEYERDDIKREYVNIEREDVD